MTTLPELLTEAQAERKTVTALIQQAVKPPKPTKRPTFRANALALVPTLHQSAFSKIAVWSKAVRDGPMRNVMNGKRATKPSEPFNLFDFRWICNYTFSLKAQTRAFGLESAVKEIAELYLGLLKHPISFDTVTLERTISPGVVASDLLVMLDNPHLPECVAAEKLMKAYLVRFKSYLRQRVATKYPGKPWWWETQNFPHALAQYCAFLYGDYLSTGDKESLAGFERISQQLLSVMVYAKTAAGIEVVNMPHFVMSRERDINPQAKDQPNSTDATYIETLLAALISLYWMGAPGFTSRLLAALGHTVMLTNGPEGFAVRGVTAAEALCGAVPVGQKSRDGQDVLILRGGEVVKTPGIRANRTTTRQDSVVQIRGAHFAATAFAVQRNPEMAKLYHQNLDDASKQDRRAQAPAFWRLLSEAQPKGYLEGGR